MKVYAAINAVQAALAVDGIGKDRKNVQQGYSFRGIDDVYNALAPLLAKHGLCVLPRILTRQCEERTTAKGGVLFYVTVEAEFDFVSAEDGSTHVVRTFGEAMDSGDKATNKAMSAAYKYAAFQAFAIPTEGDNDADNQTHQLADEADRRVQAFKEAYGRLSESVEYIQDRLKAGDYRPAAEEWYGLDQQDQMALYLAPTKGGCFSTEERRLMKENFGQFSPNKREQE